MAAWRTRTARPLGSTRITGLRRYLRDGPPPCPASVLCPSRFPPLGALPLVASQGHRPSYRRLCRGDRFSRSAWEPESSSRHLYAGHRLGGKQVSPRLLPEHGFSPGFDVVLAFDTSSVVRFRSPSRLLPDALSARLFPRRSAPRHLTDAPRGGLQPPPAGRLRRANLHLPCSIAWSALRSSTSLPPSHS